MPDGKAVDPIPLPEGQKGVRFPLLPKSNANPTIDDETQVFLNVELTKQVNTDKPMLKVELAPRMSVLKGEQDKCREKVFHAGIQKKSSNQVENEFEGLEKRMTELERKPKGERTPKEEAEFGELPEKIASLRKQAKDLRAFELAQYRVKSIQGIMQRSLAVATDLCYEVDGIRVVAARVGGEN